MTVGNSTRAPNARTARTRTGILDALEEIVREGDPSPSARDIAERADVSVRTVFAHFSTLEDLHTAMGERAIDQVVEIVEPIDADAPLTSRVVALCEERARVHERIGALRRAATPRRASSQALTDVRGFGRRASREQLEQLFAGELAGLDIGTRARTVAALDAVLSGETWDLLTVEYDFDTDVAILTTSEAVMTLLTSPAERERTGDMQRTGDTDLHELDVQIDRLLRALEVGGPADLIAPRLRSLHARRGALAEDAACR